MIVPAPSLSEPFRSASGPLQALPNPDASDERSGRHFGKTSTGGSRLNRAQVKYCLQTLVVLVPVIQLIVIEKGCGDDWPELCYPPVS